MTQLIWNLEPDQSDVWELSTTSILTEDGFNAVLGAFSLTTHWNKKHLTGTLDDNALLSPCIIVENHLLKFHNLFAFEAAWLLTNGPVADEDGEISHHCTSWNPGISPCINTLHMRLEPHWMNNERLGDQGKLRDHRKDKRSTWLKGREDPLFLVDIGAEMNCEHSLGSWDDGLYPCFMNLNVTRRFTGLFWFEQPVWQYRGPVVQEMNSF